MNRQKGKMAFLPLFFLAINFALTGQTAADNLNLIFFQAFDKGKFVDALKTGDIELKVNGQLAEVKGLTLVLKSKVKRNEGDSIDSPLKSRVLILDFKGYEYDQKFGHVVRYLFHSPYSPTDTISLVTPINVYGFSPQSLRDYSPEQLIEAGTSILKKDISLAGRTRIENFQEMTRFIKDLARGSPPKDILTQYQQRLENLKNARRFDDSVLFKAAFQFSKVRAQKRYVVIYQQEFIPIPTSEAMNTLLANTNLMFQASELFRSIETDKSVDLQPVIQELVSSGIIVDFLYYKTYPRLDPEVKLKELSTDMFEFYSKLAKATGGILESTNTPLAQVKKIVENMENYYLLTYTAPAGEDEEMDEPTPEINVRVKNQNYSITCIKL